jgi:hypothetical protein
VTLFDFLSLKNDVNVASKSNKQKKLCKKINFLLASWRSMTKTAGSGSESGSISQTHGSADPDPDQPQNVMDPQHWKIVWKTLIPTVMWLLYGVFYLKNDVNVTSKSNKQKTWRKKLFFVDVLKVTDENSRIRIRIH